MRFRTIGKKIAELEKEIKDKKTYMIDRDRLLLEISLLRLKIEYNSYILQHKGI